MKRVVVLLALVWAGPAHGDSGVPNLVSNAGFEETSGSSKADHWAALVKGVAAQFSIDRNVRHGGRCSMRIDAAEVTRAYIWSEAMAVAPGEKLRVGAWARTQDVPAGQGTTIVIAEYLNARDGPAGRLAKVGVAETGSQWQQISGRLQVPEQAVWLRLRLGFSYSKGTVWWDDVHVEPARDSVVARLDLPDECLYPADGGVQVTLLNRLRQTGAIGVRVNLDQRTASSRVELTGKPVQTVKVPLQIATRGKKRIQIEVLDAPDGGRVGFSSPAMNVAVPQPLALAPLMPTHGVVEDGPGILEGEAEIALAADSPQQNQMSVSVVDSSGRVKASRNLEGVTAGGIRRFDVKLPSMEAGTYAVRVAVNQSGGSPVVAERMWRVIRRGQARTTINAAGFLECDGKAIYPLGMFNNSGRLRECATAGLNIVHTYNAARVHPGRRPDDERLERLLDQAEKVGMKCLLLVPMEYAFAGDWESFARRIRMFRNHPALLAWDEEEGIARGDMDLAALGRMREIVAKQDPHHPFMVGDSHAVITRVTDRSHLLPEDLMDLGMWWWYPFPLSAGRGDALQGEADQSRGQLDPPAFLRQGDDGKPVWIGVQSYRKPGPNGRYPTAAEYRAQAYVAIIHGAKGLMWYGGSVTRGLFLDPEQGRWEDLKKVIAELRELAPVLMNPSLETPMVDPADAPISVGIKAAPGGRLLIAVNRSTEEQTVGVRVPRLETARVSVRGENRQLGAAGGVIQDRFEPLAVHLYELPAPD